MPAKERVRALMLGALVAEDDWLRVKDTGAAYDFAWSKEKMVFRKLFDEEGGFESIATWMVLPFENITCVR